MTFSFADRLQAWAAGHGIPLEYLPEAASTNLSAREKQYPNGAIVLAEKQTAGRGQRGNSWSSATGENLTFSVVLHPDFLPPERQFYLSKAVCLALSDTLDELGLDPAATCVKWPNDLYIASRKVAGLLIEHDLAGSCIARSIVGIGLNVNQTEFSPELPNPTSLAREAGHAFDRAEVLFRLYAHLGTRYGQLGEGAWEVLDEDYLRRLYLLNLPWTFKEGGSGEYFRAIITGVLPTGELEVHRLPDGPTRRYLFKEIEIVL